MKTIATHSGAFHTDEVFAVATLFLRFPNEEIRVIRSRDSVTLSSVDIVVDVGGMYDPSIFRFDHHQEGGAGARENGIPYASFGLIWKEYGLGLLEGNEQAWKYLDQKLVCPIDAVDNGISLSTNLHKDVYPFTLQDVIETYHGSFDGSSEANDEDFHKAVLFAQGVLQREIKKSLEYQTLQKVVEEFYQSSKQKDLIILDGKYPWVEVMLSHPEPLFVIYPDREGGRWVAKTVPASLRSFERRKLFPPTWAGKTTKDLEAASGVVGALFCHTGRFIVVADSKEGAIALAEKALAD